MSANTGSTPSLWARNRAICELLRSDLYENIGLGRWRSPLGWEVQMNGSDPRVTIFDPDGSTYMDFGSGIDAHGLDRVLP